MTHTLKILEINDAGSAVTTVDLNSGTNVILDYVPRSFSAAQIEELMRGGSIYDEPTVAEPISAMLTTATAALMATAIQTIQLLFVKAQRRRQMRTGNRVFLQWQPDGGATLYRAEIVEGKAEFSDGDGLDWQWIGFKVKVLIGLSRRVFEANSETQLTLTNGNGTDDTAGLPVYNASDGSGASPTKRHNYVEIDAAESLGVLPCPIRLAITNTYATAARRIYIAHKAQGTPASFTHILEAEDATLGTGVANAVDVNASAGNVSNVTNVPAAVRTLFTWTISAAQAAYVLSQWIRVLARFSTLPSNSTIYARLTLKDSTTGAIVAQTDYQLLSATDYLQALPTLQLSPNLQGQTTPGAMKLLLEAKDSAATGDFGLDFIQLSPIEAGNGFRYLKPIDETLVSVPATTGLITDNPIDGAIYIESRQGIYRGYGGPLMLMPGALQRLYFLRDNTDATAQIAATLTVKAFVRPRVLTV